MRPAIKVYPLLFVGSLLTLAGCEDKVESPTPTAVSVEPALVCGEQLETIIQVNGTQLSALPIEILTEDPGLTLPDLQIQRVTNLDGTEGIGNRIDLDDSPEADQVRWFSQDRMEFDVYPELMLEPGMYDLYAINGDGQTAHLPGAFTVTPRPTLTAVQPNIACSDQYENSLVLTGTTFLTVNGTLPQLAIGGDAGVILTPTSAEGCFDLPGPVSAQACDTLHVTFPQQALPPGIYELIVTNPSPAGCATEEVVRLEIVPPPSVAQVAPLLACTAQGDRVFEVTGMDFLSLQQDAGTVLPGVAVGNFTTLADTLDDCTPLAGPAPGQRCTTLTFTIPLGMGELGVQAVNVTNPEPAQCISTENVVLELVPPPTLNTIEPALVCGDQFTNDLVLSGSDFIVVPGDGGDLLPVIAFGDALELTATGALDCVDLPGPIGAQRCDRLTVSVEALALAPNVYDIVVTNPPPAGCLSTQAVQFEVIPPPTLASIDPVLACVEQADRAFDLNGTNFLVLGDVGSETYPVISVGDYEAPADSATGCMELEGPVTGRLCTDLVFTVVAATELTPGVQAVSVINPAPASCVTQESVNLEIVPAPVLSRVQEDLVCSDQLVNTLTLTGSGFVVVPDPDNEGETLYPTLAFSDSLDVMAIAAGGCDDLDGDLTGAQTCSSLTVELQPLDLSPAVYDLVLTNPQPAGCESTDAVEFEVVGPPTLASVDPILACVDDAERAFLLTGTNFLVLAGAAMDDPLTFPTINLGDSSTVAANAAPTDDDLVCTALTGPVAGWLCTAISFSLANDSGLTPDVYSVSVTNPDPAGCTTEEEGTTLEVVPSATLASVVPALFCTDLPGGVGVALDITGTGFLLLPDGGDSFVVPTITIGDYTGTVDLPDTGTCAARTDSPTGGFECTALTAQIPDGGITAGAFTASITNPAPAGCSSSEAVDVEVLNAPTLATLVPAGLCLTATVREAIIQGGGFLVLGTLEVPTAEPTVAFETAGAVTVIEYTAESCTALTTVAGFLCDELTVDIAPLFVETPPSSGNYQFSAYDEAITVTNPPGADDVTDCATSNMTPVVLFETPSPEITSFEPVPLCDDNDVVEVQVIGTGFLPGATVTVTGAESGAITVMGINDDGVSIDSDPDTLIVTFASPLDADVYTLELTNPDGCSDRSGDTFTVEAAPFLFNVDPPVVYQKITTRVTLYIAVGTGSLDFVELIPPDGGDPIRLNVIVDVDNPNTVLADIPGTLVDFLAAGQYTIRLTETTGCDAEIIQAITIEADISTVDVDLVDPPFGAAGASLAVDITGAGFAELPRVYLNPVDPGPDDVATLLRGITYDGALALTAVVPETGITGAQLAAGEYDVIVVNPDGTIGVGSGTVIGDDVGLFRLTVIPPPVIDAVSPPRISTNATVDDRVSIDGANFINTEVSFICVDDTGAFSETVLVPGGDIIVNMDGTNVTVPPPSRIGGNSLTEGDICVVRVRNTVDDTWGEFSAVSVGSSSGNIFGVSPGPPMAVHRRAPAVEAGRPTNTARFLYAIGGDDGDEANAYDSIEFARLNRFGLLQAWSTLPSGLANRADDDAPALWRPDVLGDPVQFNLTRADIRRLGDYLYVVGGNDGSGPVDTVLRSQVLDPLDAPEFDSLLISINEDMDGNLSGGVEPGTWSYRIAALFAPNDAINPGGESLASDPIIVRVPDINEDDDGTANNNNGIYFTPVWRHVDRAVGYRIYRTPLVTSGSNTEQLQADIMLSGADISTLSPGDPVPVIDYFVEDGIGMTSAAITPLPLGTLGAWAHFETLPNGPRESACIAFANDPCNPSTWDENDGALTALCGGGVNADEVVYLYVAGGSDTAAPNPQNNVDVLPVVVAPGGIQASAGWATLASPITLPTGRWECGAFEVSAEFHTVVADWETWIYFGAGRTAGGIEANQDMRVIQVGPGGEAEVNTVASPPTPNRVGYALASASNFLYVMGGERNSGFTDETNETEITGPPGLSGFSATPTATLTTPRFLPGSTQESSFIFIVGGWAEANTVDTCTTANNGVCEDGRPGSLDATCTIGTDDSDCNLDDDSCGSTGNDCEDGRIGAAGTMCMIGTDFSDCGASPGAFPTRSTDLTNY